MRVLVCEVDECCYNDLLTVRCRCSSSSAPPPEMRKPWPQGKTLACKDLRREDGNGCT